MASNSGSLPFPGLRQKSLEIDRFLCSSYTGYHQHIEWLARAQLNKKAYFDSSFMFISVPTPLYGKKKNKPSTSS